jgi:hypothetical protein
MKYVVGDVVEFRLDLGGEPLAKGIIVDTLVHDYRILPEGADQLWVVHPQEIKRKIGHADLEQYLSARFH